VPPGANLLGGLDVVVERRPHVLRVDLHAGLDQAMSRAHVGFVANLHHCVRVPEVCSHVSTRAVVLHAARNDFDAIGEQGRRDRVTRKAGHRFAVPGELHSGGAVDDLAGLLAEALHALPPILLPGIGGFRNSLVAVLRSTLKNWRHPRVQYQVSTFQSATLSRMYR